jgi:hypothetical protein
MSDNLSFGNPTNDLIGYLKKESYLDSLLPEIKSYYPPSNNNQEVITDLQEMKLLVESLDENTKKKYLYYDTNYTEHIVRSLEKSGIEKQELIEIIKDVREDILPLVIKVKYHFQRIRPIQLAYYYNIPLYPYPSCLTNTPTYPSGHSFHAKTYAIVLGNKYPKFFKPLMELADDIGKSRVYLGLNYKSDVNFANYMADIVANHSEFIRKYKL